MKKVLITETELIKLIRKSLIEVEENKTKTPANKKIITPKGYFLYIVFPTYQPSMDGETQGFGEKVASWFTRATLGGTDSKKWGATGHALFVIIDQYNSQLFEFGPYGPNKTGMAKETSLGYASTKHNFQSLDKNDFIDVARRARAQSLGRSSNLKANVLVFGIPNPNAAINWAYKNKNTPYRGWDYETGTDNKGNATGNSNCGTFALDALKAGGATFIPSYCSPFPASNYDAIKNHAITEFSI
jgi:hypothetical protein